MRALADALVLALTYFGRPLQPGEDWEQETYRQLEEIADWLREASPEEQRVVAEAAERWLERERRRPDPDPRMLESFGRFMEDMFGHPWVSNRPGPEEA